MIGNSWAFVILAAALGIVLGCRRKPKRLLLLLPPLILLLGLSHFYGLLTLGVMILAVLLEELGRAIIRREFKHFSLALYFFSGLGISLLAWWLLPLGCFSKYTAQFGVNWNIRLLSTLTTAEAAAFSIALVSAVLLALRHKESAPLLRAVLIFLGLLLLLYFGNTFLNSVAFINVRLWPSLYFAAFLLLIAVLNIIFAELPQPLPLLVAAGLAFLFARDRLLRQGEQLVFLESFGR